MSLTIETVKNPAWFNSSKTAFNCEVKFKEFTGPVPFTATADDPTDHGKTIWTNGNAGDYGVIAEVPAAQQLTDAKAAKLSELKAAFKNAMATGHFTLSLGWDIDCRRSSGDNDESNMEGLLQIAKKNGLADTDPIDANGIKGYDNQWHPATVADVRDTIIPEMCEYGASLYQKKFQLQAKVEAVTLASGSDGSAEVAQVQAITW